MKTLHNFRQMKETGEPISWITAYTYPMAYAAEKAGIDMILVGDSGGMVELGYKNTNPVTMDEMIMLSKAARRGAPDTFLIGDMPQGSYEASNEDAVRNALRFVKEASCDAVKLEGGFRVASRASAIANAGIVVIGHLGLTPQSAATFGGYRVQGKTVESFEQIVTDAYALQSSGCSMLLLEAMPEEPAAQIGRKLDIPVLGIGAGGKLDGQLLIMHDILGFFPNFKPRFAKCYVEDKSYATMLDMVQDCVNRYILDVKAKNFPTQEYIYPLKPTEYQALTRSELWD